MFKLLGGNWLLHVHFLLRTLAPLIIAGILLNLAPLTAFSSDDMEVVTVINIIEDTTWESGKIYRVSGTKTISENVTLTIEPGAVVKFVNTGILYVEGNILAVGTSDNVIGFTVGNDTSPGMGQQVAGINYLWKGLFIDGTGEAILDYVQIKHASIAGIESRGNLEVYNSTFQNNVEGIHVTGGNSIIENNGFSFNATGIKTSGAAPGQSTIKSNDFVMNSANNKGIDLFSTNLLVEIFENSFRGSGFLTSTVGIKLNSTENPENRLISIMFNTFENIGKGVEIVLGGHILRGNNFLSAYEGGVFFSSTPAIGQIYADIRYNYWNDTRGPAYLGNILGSVTIKDIPLLQFEPWGTRLYEPHYEALEVEIDYPQNGAYVIGAAEFRVSAADPNLKALAFYLDDNEICSFEGADFVNGSEIYSFQWELPEEDAANDSYIFKVTAANHLGEQVQDSLTFKYLGETPPLPELSIASPQQGSTLRGNVTIFVEAAAAEELGEDGLEYLYLEIDGELAAQAAAPYNTLSWEFETGSYGHGQYLLTAKVGDVLGQEVVQQISVIVDNRPPAQDYYYWDDTPWDVNETKKEDDGNEDKFSEQNEDMVLRCASEIFKDLEPGHPALEAISYLYARGIFRGVDVDKFGPDLQLSRAQTAALLMRVPLNFNNRNEQALPGDYFKDVDRETWFSSTVNRAAYLGLLEGYEDGTFRPRSPVSGAEFAALLLRLERFLFLNGENTDRDKIMEVDQGKRNALQDKTPQWARESTAQLLRKGILGNDELQWFEPRQPLTRAEAAILLWKACLYYAI